MAFITCHFVALSLVKLQYKVKWIVHSKKKCLSSFTHTRVVSKAAGLSSVEHDILKNVCVFCPYNECQRGCMNKSILQNIFFLCSTQVSHTGLEQHKGD